MNEKKTSHGELIDIFVKMNSIVSNSPYSYRANSVCGKFIQIVSFCDSTVKIIRPKKQLNLILKAIVFTTLEPLSIDS